MMKYLALFFLWLFFVSLNVNAQEIIQVKPDEVQSLFKKASKEKAVLVNLWATWCGPCIEEFPDIVHLAQKYQDDLTVIFISADFLDDLDRVNEFLKNQHVTWTTYIKTGSESEFIEQVHPKWSGALPFSLILKKGGKELAYWENKAEMSKFEAFIQQAIEE